MKRSGKFYRTNEKDVMQLFGLEPTKNSGSGWIEKEDGQNEHVICQLKSTDATSIKLDQHDIKILEYNASVSHKLPLFVVQFIKTGDIYCVVKADILAQVAKYINTGGSMDNIDLGIVFGDEQCCDVSDTGSKHVIKSTDSARMEMQAELAQKYKKKKRSAT